MKLKGNTGYLAATTLLLSLGVLVLWEFWLEGLILVDFLEITMNKNHLDRWTFIVSCLAIVCFSLILPFQSMKTAVDEMKSLETALHGEQTLSKVFFTVDNSIILVIDTSNKIMQVNQKTVHILGYKEEELLGQDWISLLVPEASREAIKNQYKQFTSDKSQNLIRLSAPVLTKGGSEKMIDWQCSPLKDERGMVYGSINSGQDISEPMRLRKEISLTKGKYEPQIKKLTADLNFNKKKYHSEAIKSANARARFKFWFDLEATLIDLSSEEISSPEEVNKRIKKALQLFGEMTNVDQGYVFHFTQDNTHMSNTHLWVSGEPLLEPDPSEEASMDTFSWFKKKILNKEVVDVSKITEMPKEAAAEQKAYHSQGIRSLINAPLINNDTVVGYIGFESNQKERVWDADEINVIKALGRLICSLIHPSTPLQSPSTTAAPDSADSPIELDAPGISMDEISLEVDAPGISMDEISLEVDTPQASSTEKELKEKIEEMEQEKSGLVAELLEQKDAESELRADRDSIEHQLKEKSLEVEKLLAKGEGDALQMDDTAELSAPTPTFDSDEGLEDSAEISMPTPSFDSDDDDQDLIEDILGEQDSESVVEEDDEGELEEHLSQVAATASDEGEETGDILQSNQAMKAELEELRNIQEEFDTNSDQLEDTRQELENLEIANEQMMTDIEERDYLIQEAKEKADRYEQMDLPLFTLDQEGAILTWNKTAAKLTGYISELALETPISFMFAEKDTFDLENELLIPLQENSSLRLEIPIKKPNGTVFNALVSLASFKDRNGVLSTLGYFVNLSDGENKEEVDSIKRQFTTLLGHSGLILVNLSPDYLISDINEKAETTFSWERDATLEKNFFEVILSEKEGDETFTDIQGRMENEENVELETRSTLEDNIEHTFLWNLVKETDPKDESVKGILAIGQDVTELHTAQNQLRENEFILNLIVDKATDGMITIDEYGIVQSFNEGAENLFGYLSQEIIGQNVSRLMPEPYSKEHDNYLGRYRDSGESSFVGGAPREFTAQRKDGSTFPMEIALKEMYQGYQRMFVGIARDVRKRKESEIKLVECLEKYNRFMDAESDAVLILNGHTQQIMECNPAAPLLYGYEPEEFMKLNFKDLIADADQPASGIASASSRGLGSTHKISHLYQKKKDDDFFPANISTSSFRLNNIDYELKIISDTSDQVQLEKELKAARNELDKTLQESDSRSAQVLRNNDEQKISFREEKLALIEQITSSVVDLVNNPIQGIENILEQVKERADMEDIHKGLVTVAMNECHRVAELINKMKNYHIPTTEELEPLDVHQVLDEVLQSNMDALQDRTITLEKEYADDLPVIDGVNQQIRQAINNIVKNAEESFVNDEGKITIATEQEGSHVKIHIRDTGCGIPAKDLDRIFDPFFTTKSATHRPGLGLLASLGIIKNHQGEIDVHSQPGGGTTFTVTLPLKQISEPNNGQS